MNTIAKVLLLCGGSITTAFGIWHYAVPAVYKWFSYVPTIPDELKNAITATNFFLSTALVLLGVLTVYSTVIHKELHGILIPMMALLWVSRVVYQIIRPQGKMIPGLSIIMAVIFSVTALCFIIPLIIKWVDVSRYGR